MSASLLNSAEILCKDVRDVNVSGRCSFIHETEDCLNDLSYIDYTAFIYCAFGSSNAPVAIFACVIWMFILFIALGVTATDFLCPSLFVISKTLHMSQSVAGVTLVAFGNGSPDIFAAIAGMRQGRPSLVVGGLFGGGVYVTSCVVGSIFIIKSFRLIPLPFIRDIAFYLIAVSWFFYLFMVVEAIRIYDAIGFLLLYLAYVAIVVLTRFCQKNSKEDNAHMAPKDDGQIKFEGIQDDDDPEAGMVIMRGFVFLGDDPASDKPPPIKTVSGILDDTSDITKMNELTVNENDLTVKSRVSIFEDNSVYSTISGEDLVKNGRGKKKSLGDNVSKRSGSSMFTLSQNQLFQIRRKSKEFRRASKEFFEKINPIDFNGWKQQNWGGRSFEIVKSPIRFFLLLTTPMADPEGKHKWNKLLSAFHCISGPIFVIFATGNGFIWIGDVIPLPVIIFIVASIIAIIIVSTSSYETPPFYYNAYSAYLGFAVAVTWIYCISNELVGLLRSIGIAFHLTDEFIGMTILAWGNALLDFVSNFSIAKRGFPRMAIAACFGAPLLSLLIGVGIPATLQLSLNPSETIALVNSDLIVIIYAALAGVLIITCIKMCIFKFYVKRWFGIVLVVIYLILLIIGSLEEFNVIYFPLK